MKALVQREDSLIKLRQSQNRISGFSTDSVRPTGEDILYMFVTLSPSMSTPGKLKRLLDHGGNRTRDLRFASPMLRQLSYEVKLV